MSFGDFLYELRKEKGLTQSEVAEKLGVTNKAVSKWETGETFPETAQLLPLAGLFGVTVDELLRGERRETPVSVAPAEKETPPVDLSRFALSWSAGQIALLISGIAVILLGLLFIFWVEKYGVCWFMLSTALGAFCFVEFAFLHSAPLSVNPTVYRRNGFLIGLGAALIVGVCGIFCAEEGYELFSENVRLTVFFVVIALAAALFVGAGVTMPKRKGWGIPSKNRWVGKVCGVIMMLCALVYLLFGYLWQRWDLSSVIFVVGGLLCGIVAVIGSK